MWLNLLFQRDIEIILQLLSVSELSMRDPEGSSVIGQAVVVSLPNNFMYISIVF